MEKKKVEENIEEFKPYIVHFEYMTSCPQCKNKWSGMYKIGEDFYICIECFEKEKTIEE